MKISTFAKFIAGLFVVADQSLAKSEPRSNYNILFPDDQDLATILKDIPQELKFKNINLYEISKNFTTVSLTTTEANTIAELLQPYKGIIEPDYVYNAADVAANNTQILTVIPNCKVPIYGEDIVIMGTKIYPSQPALMGYTLSTIYDPYNMAPCNPHETKVAEVIANVINGGDINFLNAVSADCLGNSVLSTLNEATNAAIKYKQSAGKNRRMTINISSTGPRSEILNSIFENAVKSDIRVVTAAGNFEQDANNFSPASLGCTVAESIGATTGQGPAVFTNYGECVDVYLLGCMPLRNPLTGMVSNSCGTSYSSPFEAARGLIQRFYFPQYTPAQTKFTLKNNTISITVPPGSKFSGTMSVITADMACPKNNNPDIFSGVVPINRWLALAPPSLCVQFTAKSKDGAMFVKFIDNSSGVCTVTIDAQQKNAAGFVHSVKCDNTTLATTYTTTPIIASKDKQFKIVQQDNQILVTFRNKNRDQKIISAGSIGNRTAIAFGRNGTATFRNALRCKL